ncbi:MAG: B12-binding domain-containing radical SAM protein [Deltaproteobacteria bacterium]|nr:B12-binding domain-containing radical SAM protein [Deltaproteobacteria bacterium]
MINFINESHGSGSSSRGRKTLILVLPPQPNLLEGFSSGLISLANFVDARLPGVEVKLLDLGRTTMKELALEAKEVLKSASGRVFVGVTSTTATYQNALKTLRIFKQLIPECITIMGGHHVSCQDKVALSNHIEVDFIIRGEGEEPLVKLLDKYPCISEVPNLSYRDGIHVKRNEDCELLAPVELDEISPIFRNGELKSPPGKFDHTTYVSARGCPLGCSFCSVGNTTIRFKSIEAVIEDLRLLVGELGYKNIAVEDNFFAQSPKRTIALCRAIEDFQKEFPFRWDCQTRVESCCRQEVIEAMDRAGCEAIYLGVEAFEPDQLLYLGKTGSPEKYLDDLHHKAAPMILQSNIDCYINIQLGLPGENESSREASLAELKELGEQALELDKRIVIFPQLHVIYPGTKHFFKAGKDGILGPDPENVFEHFTAWEIRQEPILHWLGANFAHGTGGIPVGILYGDRLRSGDFEINPTAVLEVVNFLDDLNELPGIRVFSYSKYITASRTLAEPQLQTYLKVLSGGK